MSETRARRVPVPTLADTPRTNGLKKLNLPTVGATQAAADAAAAAMSSPPSLSRSDRSVSIADSETADAERTRYFRRYSSLPSVPAMPKPVLKFVDASRGVLFALSQMYSAITQYTSVSTDERLVAHFSRMLSMSVKSMSVLINALDRLDAISCAGMPEPVLVRHVLQACHDALLTFRRAVTMLHIQLPQLGQTVDPRFSRTLLLLLYGSVAELRNSAMLMAPHVRDVVPFLEKHVSHTMADASTSVSSHRTARQPSQADVSFEEAGELSQPASSTPLKKCPQRLGLLTNSMRSPGVSPREIPKHDATARGPLSPGTVFSASSRMRVLSHNNPGGEDGLFQLLLQVTDNAMQIWSELGDYVQAGMEQGHEDEQDATRIKRLRDVNESCASMMDMTKRLQWTRDRASDANLRSSQADMHDLWEQCNQFVRATIHISTLVRAVSVTYPFPRDLMRAMGDLNQGCAALAVHLHQLSPP